VADRSGQTGADDDRKDKPDRGRKRRQNDGRDHHRLLPAQRRRRVASHESDHLASYCVELAIEIVAQLIDPLARFRDRLLVAAVKQRQQARDFLVELDAGAVGHIGEAGIDPNERRRVAEAGAFGDQGIEQTARGLASRSNVPPLSSKRLRAAA